MTLLDTLKSLLGLESTDGSGGRDREAGVTVEREPGGEPAPVSSPSEDDSDDEAAGEEAAGEEAAEETSADEAAEEPAEDDAGEADEEGEPTDVLEGIGPAYAGRLSDAGIETVAQLADADAADLAEETDIAEGRLETWIERAGDR